MIRNPRPRRGIATITAIAMLGLTGVAMASLVQLAAHDAARTRRQVIEAQLRQIQLASLSQMSAIARAGTMDDPAAAEVSLVLPASLREGGGAVSAQVATTERGRDVVVTATFGDHVLVQTLHYVRDDREWVLGSATLNEAAIPVNVFNRK